MLDCLPRVYFNSILSLSVVFQRGVSGINALFRSLGIQNASVGITIFKLSPSLDISTVKGFPYL